MQVPPADLVKVTPLNSSNLRLSDATSKIDKDHFINEYIRSQRTYSTMYATEGRAALAAENKRQSDNMTPPQPVLQSYFDTPILKPRVPLGQSKNNEESSCRSISPADHSRRRKKRIGKENRSTAVETSRSTSKPQRVTKEYEGPDKPKLKQQKLDQFTETTQKPSCNIVSKKLAERRKRQRSPGTSADEHNARLAERRQRRRKKRKLVERKDNSNQEDEHEATTEEVQRGTKGKKNKSVSMSAGLALMHGFSANNIGKNRLTVEPDKRIGVFNKGKASVKIPVKPAPAKPKVAAKHFSETQFLNKRHNKPNISTSSDKRSSEAGSSTSSESQTSGQSKLKHKKQTKARKKGNKDPAPEIDASSQHSDGDFGSSDATSSINSNEPERKTAETVIWDIEVEGNSLLSGSKSSEPLRIDPEPTIILNTGALEWSMKKAEEDTGSTNHKRRPSLNIEKGATDIPAPSGRRYSPSIGPSQSASQAGQHLMNELAVPTSSRFFYGPSKAATSLVISNAQEDDAPITPMINPEHIGRHPITEESPVLQFEGAASVSDSLWKTPASLSTRGVHMQVEHAPYSLSVSALERELQALDADDYASPCTAHAQESRYSRVQGPFVDDASSFASVDPKSYLGAAWSGYDTAAQSEDPAHTDEHQAAAHRWRLVEDCRPSTAWGDGDLHALSNEESTEWEQDTYYMDMIEPIHEYIPADSFERLPVHAPDDEDIAMSVNMDYGVSEADYVNPENITHYVDDHSTIGTIPLDSRPPTASSHEELLSELSADLSSSDVSAIRLPQFSQGRALLLGLSERDQYRGSAENRDVLSRAELQVARTLRGHWLPQRP